LLSIDSASVGFKVLKEQGYLSKTFMLKMMFVLLLFRLGIFSEQRLAQSFLTFYKGRRLQTFIDTAEDFFKGYLKPNYDSKVLKRLKWHQEQGHITVLLSGSIAYYLTPVTKDLGIDHLLCTYLEVASDGILTGRSRGPVCVGNVKVEQAVALADELNIDLSESYAYGNSQLDIPILEKVGHPVMVKPSKRLLKHGEKQVWVIL
jgi:putative phosphoserine phosphatase/1-acylglycerol-3-phosphate O-acyltransferase